MIALISSRVGAPTQPRMAPAYCFGVPPVGADIEVLLSPYDRYAPTVYGPARVVVQSDTSCAFEAYSQVLGSRRFEAFDSRFPAVILVGAAIIFVPAFLEGYNESSDRKNRDWRD